MAKDTLKEIVAKKKERIAISKQSLSEDELKARSKDCPASRPFITAINKPRDISLIAEIKRQSPSAGLLKADFNPAAIAQVYEQSGAQALSVLTEEDHFAGSPAFIMEAKQSCQLPVLRKDFIIEPYQVYESKVIGADAILLIADLVSKDTLSEMMGIAASLGMAVLLEAHGEKDLKKTISLKPDAIGINNRDLRTLEVDFNVTQRLFPLIPKNTLVVVESGLSRHQDILFLKILGVKAVLIGQAFMQSPDIREKVCEVMGW